MDEMILHLPRCEAETSQTPSGGTFNWLPYNETPLVTVLLVIGWAAVCTWNLHGMMQAARHGSTYMTNIWAWFFSSWMKSWHVIHHYFTSILNTKVIVVCSSVKLLLPCRQLVPSSTCVVPYVYPKIWTLTITMLIFLNPLTIKVGEKPSRVCWLNISWLLKVFSTNQILLGPMKDSAKADNEIGQSGSVKDIKYKPLLAKQ